jgi:3-methyl-2-oxobutanoate hydroxymethyltransferase
MGHIGFTPQSINQLGGFKIQGKNLEAAQKLLDDAMAIKSAGAFAIVLEMVPAPLASLISQSIEIPTIGIGAGAGCDGQVQVVSDILGLFTDFVPKHTRQYAKIADIMSTAITEYYKDVKNGNFPTNTHSFPMEQSVITKLRKQQSDGNN